MTDILILNRFHNLQFQYCLVLFILRLSRFFQMHPVFNFFLSLILKVLLLCLLIPSHVTDVQLGNRGQALRRLWLINNASLRN